MSQYGSGKVILAQYQDGETEAAKQNPDRIPFILKGWVGNCLFQDLLRNKTDVLNYICLLIIERWLQSIHNIYLNGKHQMLQLTLSLETVVKQIWVVTNSRCNTFYLSVVSWKYLWFDNNIIVLFICLETDRSYLVLLCVKHRTSLSHVCRCYLVCIYFRVRQEECAVQQTFIKHIYSIKVKLLKSYFHCTALSS